MEKEVSMCCVFIPCQNTRHFTRIVQFDPHRQLFKAVNFILPIQVRMLRFRRICYLSKMHSWRMTRSGFEFRTFVLSSALSCLILVCWRKPARGLKATTVEEAEAGRAVQSVKVLKGKEESDLVRLKEWVRPVSLP